MNLEAWLTRTIPERDEQLLLRAGGGVIEEVVRRDYWYYRGIRDRLDISPIPADTLYLLVAQALIRAKHPPHDIPGQPFPILKLAKADKIRHGDTVEVWWRGAEYRCIFLEANYSQKCITVMLDGEERKIQADCVLRQCESVFGTPKVVQHEEVPA